MLCFITGGGVLQLIEAVLITSQFDQWTTNMNERDGEVNSNLTKSISGESLEKL